MTAPASPSQPDAPPAFPDRGPEITSVRRIVRNSTLNLLSQGLYAALNLVIVFLLARCLTQAEFGLYYTLFTLITVAQVVLEAGVSLVLTRRLAQAPAVWRETIAESVGLYTLLLVLTLALFLGLGGLWSSFQGDVGLWWCCAAGGVACAAMHVQRFCAGVWRAFDRFGQDNWTRLLQGATFVASILALFLRHEATLTRVLLLFAASHLLAAGYLLVALQHEFHCLAWRWHVPRLFGWLAEGVPLGLGDMLRQLTWHIHTLLLSLLQTAVVVAIYNVAYRPLMPLNSVALAIVTAVFPSFARLAEKDRAALGRAFANCIRLLWVTSVPLAVAICLYARPLILLLAGESYLEAMLPLRILIWIAVLAFVSFPFRFLFTAVGEGRLYVILVLGVLLLETAIEGVLIPFWGYLGACLGNVLGELVFTTTGLLACRWLGLRGIEWGRLLGALPAGLAMAAVLWLVSGAGWLWLVPGLAAGTALYFGLCVLFGALAKDEVQHFLEVLMNPFRHTAKA